MKVLVKTGLGGSVELNAEHGVTVSYGVANVGFSKPAECLYVYMTMPNGRKVQLFLNRQTGLLVVDAVRADEQGGNECVRMNINAVKLPSKKEIDYAASKQVEEAVQAEIDALESPHERGPEATGGSRSDKDYYVGRAAADAVAPGAVPPLRASGSGDRDRAWA